MCTVQEILDEITTPEGYEITYEGVVEVPYVHGDPWKAHLVLVKKFHPSVDHYYHKCHIDPGLWSYYSDKVSKIIHIKAELTVAMQAIEELIKE